MRSRTYNCPVEAAIEVFGGKWKPLILWWLHQRTWRFAELRRQIPPTDSGNGLALCPALPLTDCPGWPPGGDPTAMD